MFIAANQVPECNCVVVGGTEEEVIGKMRAFLAERGIERDCRSFFVGRLSEDGTIELSEDGTIVTCVKDLPPGACRGNPCTGSSASTARTPGESRAWRDRREGQGETTTMIIQDDRTPEQKITHEWLVVGTDKCLSGWGLAEGGKSYAAWACTSEALDDVEEWVRGRSDMKHVRVVHGKYSPRGRAGHLHIYVRNK